MKRRRAPSRVPTDDRRRAFHSDRLGPFCAALAQLCGKDLVLPMNSGAEAVESAIKVARKWGYDVKGVPDGAATIIVAGGNTTSFAERGLI